MNIQASGLLSLFSGQDGLESIQQSLLQDGVLSEQFASALLEQIELLQQGQSEIPLSVQQNADLNQLQDFAGSLGKGLPGVINEADIDLEETMQALADVLKNIDAMDVDSNQFNLAELADDINESSVLLLTENDKQNKAVNNRSVSLDKALTGQAVSMSEKNNSEAMMEQNNAFQRFEKEALLSTEKNQHDVEMTDGKIMDTGTEKSLSKITSELAVLNRTVTTENRAEIPSMTRHFAHPEWGKEFSERIIWMHKQAVPSAELNLNPKHLGPISIRVDVNQDQATIAFTAQHAAVKEAIEASLPKLREMLSAQQLNLVDVNVSQQQSEQKQSQSFFQMAGDRQGQGAKEQIQEDFESGHSDAVTSVADEIEAGRAIASQGILSIFA